jgi:DNA-binding transcriptional ArsR family regulator
MSGLLPTGTDASTEQEGQLRTLWLDSEDAGELLSSLSSETARRVLTTLHDEPATASEVADRVDTSLQNARHHLTNLEEAGLVRVADTRYSQKGREMNVYAPAEDPTVVFVGREDRKAGFFESLRGLLSAVGLLALASLLVQYLVVMTTAGPGSVPRMPEALGPAGGPLIGLSPGVLFFAGGLLVVGVLLAYSRWQRARAPTPG